MKKLALCIACICLFCIPITLSAQSNTGTSQTGRTEIDATRQAGRVPFVNLNIREPQNNQEVAFSIQLLLLITLITLAPSILLLMTSFLRLSIALDFIKRALSLQQVPPTQVLNGIALFLTIFIMWPTFTEIYNRSFKPMAGGEINIETAYTEAEKPLRLFMYKQMAHDPTHVLIPAFILHELTVAFQIGIFLYLPFIIIDMVVASILMSMGMIMLPPVQISMPFKLILFVLVDGWNLLVGQLFQSFL